MIDRLPGLLYFSTCLSERLGHGGWRCSMRFGRAQIWPNGYVGPSSRVLILWSLLSLLYVFYCLWSVYRFLALSRALVGTGDIYVFCSGGVWEHFGSRRFIRPGSLLLTFIL